MEPHVCYRRPSAAVSQASPAGNSWLFQPGKSPDYGIKSAYTSGHRQSIFVSCILFSLAAVGGGRRGKAIINFDFDQGLPPHIVIIRVSRVCSSATEMLFTMWTYTKGILQSRQCSGSSRGVFWGESARPARRAGASGLTGPSAAGTREARSRAPVPSVNHCGVCGL